MELGAKSDAELALDGEAGFLTFEMVSAALASGSELPSGSLISLASRAGTYAVERVCKALAAARRFGGHRQGAEWSMRLGGGGAVIWGVEVVEVEVVTQW